MVTTMMSACSRLTRSSSQRSMQSFERTRMKPASRLTEARSDTSYEPFAAGGVGQWVDATMLDKVTGKTSSIRQYIELAEIFGPRALQADRDDASSQFALMVGGADRGLLIQTVKEYYYGEGSTAAVQFVAARLYDFLEDTKWEAPPRDVSSHNPVSPLANSTGRWRPDQCEAGEHPSSCAG